MYKIGFLYTLSHGEKPWVNLIGLNCPVENTVPLNDKMQYFPFRLTGAPNQYKQEQSSQYEAEGVAFSLFVPLINLCQRSTNQQIFRQRFHADKCVKSLKQSFQFTRANFTLLMNISIYTRGKT